MYVLSTGQTHSKFQQAALVFIHKNKICVMQTCLYMEIQCLDHLHSNPVQSVLFCDSSSGQLTQSPVPLALCRVVTHSQFCVLRHWRRILCSERIKGDMTISPGWIIRLMIFFVWDGGFLLLSYLMSILPGNLAAQFILHSWLPDYLQDTEISWYPVFLRNQTVFHFKKWKK